MADAGSPLMQLLALTVKDHIFSLQLDPAPYQRPASLRGKRDKDQLWRQRHIGHSREFLPPRQQSDLVQFREGHMRLEVATDGENKIDPRPEKAGLEFSGIIKVERSIHRHPRALA
jgi:hypothetical protein